MNCVLGKLRMSCLGRQVIFSYVIPTLLDLLTTTVSGGVLPRTSVHCCQERIPYSSS